MPPKISKPSIEDNRKATQSAEPEWLYSLYPSMRPKTAEDDVSQRIANNPTLSPKERALYSLYPTIYAEKYPNSVNTAPQTEPHSAKSTLLTGTPPSAGLKMNVAAPLLAAPALAFAGEELVTALGAAAAAYGAKKTADALAKGEKGPAPSTLIIPDAPENNAPQPETFPPATPLPDQPPSERPRQSQPPLPPSTRPEEKKEDSVLADPQDDTLPDQNILDIKALKKPIPINPGEALPEKVETGLDKIQDSGHKNFIRGLIKNGDQISGLGEDGCNIDIKGNYADVQNTLREMQEKFGGTITPQQMSAKFDYQWMDVLKVNDSLEVKARPTADSTGTPTLEIRVKEQEGDAVYTIKVRAHP